MTAASLTVFTPPLVTPQALLEMRGHPARRVVEHVIKRVAEFAKGAPQSDDITCVAVVRPQAALFPIPVPDRP